MLGSALFSLESALNQHYNRGSALNQLCQAYDQPWISPVVDSALDQVFSFVSVSYQPCNRGSVLDQPYPA
jgi:hypothetical protein